MWSAMTDDSVLPPSHAPPEVLGRPSALGVIASVGMGWGQWRVLSTIAIPLFVIGGMQCSLSTIMVPAQSSELSQFGAISPTQRSSLVMFFSIGMLLGSCFCGLLGDVLGRRCPILISYLVISLSTLAAAATPQDYGFGGESYIYPFLLSCRLLTGIGVGVGYPAARAMMSEITPESYRIVMSSTLTVAAAVGGIIAKIMSIFDDVTFYELHWRVLMFISSVLPVAVFLVAFFTLQESPVFLACVGRHEEARRGFEDLKEANRSLEADMDYDSDKCVVPGGNTVPLFERFRYLFLSRRYRGTTVTVISVGAVLELLHSTFGYMYPQYLSNLIAVPAAEQLVILSLFSFPAAMLCMHLTGTFSRKTILGVSLVIVAILSVMMRHLALHPHFHSISYIIGMETCMCGIQLVRYVGEIIVIQIAADAFPPFVASTGLSMSYAIVMIAQVVSAPLFEAELYHTGKFQSAIGLMPWLAAFALLVLVSAPTLLMPYDSMLDDHKEQTHIASAMSSYGAAGAMLGAAKVQS